ncbi:hypothetical protein fugu_019092 [Takifugu bimaculatus]|uniref:poly(ADP-ribose) glycohydrolase n=1 Tax=Takifugu bimaculatus TaxID=433685 RepID=A0A4Z2BLH1_9TELE|nr:hypothetical protein fugu_019092 [Takifugu bimaculatus]
MARNDSVQVGRLLQPDFFNTEKPDKYHQKWEADYFFSSPGTSNSEAPLKRETYKLQQTKCDSCPDLTLCCFLEDLKTITKIKRILGPLEFSSRHAVLIDVFTFNGAGGIVPQPGRDKWSSNYVKLPCSPSSVLYSNSTPKQEMRWSVISKQLKRLVEKKTVNAEDVEKAIMKYNPKYRGQWSFDALKEFVEWAARMKINVSGLFQKIAALALKLPEYVMKDIPLLQRGKAASITLSQVQISCLLANAFFCTFPHRNTTISKSEYHNYPTINFNRLFEDRSVRKLEKLKAIMHYFQVVTDDKIQLDGLVTFERRCLPDTDTNVQIWKCCKEKMNMLYVSSYGTIEDEGTGMLQVRTDPSTHGPPAGRVLRGVCFCFFQVDFANSLLGGGVLSSGLVQEEILFLVNPELIVSRLFTEKLQDNECVVVTGVQQFSTYSGFGDSFRWERPYQDPTGRDRWARRQRQILAIDALNFDHKWKQYNMRMVARELNKAYCGFKSQGEEPDIATGKWGCGAFNGDSQLKAMIQLMAAARARRGLAFFTFSDEVLEHGLKQTYSLLRKKGTTVGELFELLVDYCAIQQASGTFNVELFDYIRTRLPSSDKLSKSLL